MSINHKLFRHLLYTLIFSLGLVSLSSLTSIKKNNQMLENVHESIMAEFLEDSCSSRGSALATKKKVRKSPELDRK